MANKVATQPALPKTVSINKVQDAITFIQQLMNSLSAYLSNLAYRANLSMPADGSEVPTGPVRLNSYTKAHLPIAASYPGAMIYVTDDTGGATPAFSDGTSWRRTADRNVIS